MTRFMRLTEEGHPLEYSNKSRSSDQFDQRKYKRQSHLDDSARCYKDFIKLAGHVNSEVTSQPGRILALEILVPCILVTCLSIFFALYIVVFSICKIDFSPLILSVSLTCLQKNTLCCFLTYIVVTNWEFSIREE